MDYVKSLSFKKTPNYGFLRNLIQVCGKNLGIDFGDPVFEWTKDNFKKNHVKT